MYTNYGDINPLDHGGVFVKPITDTEFEIVKLTPLEDGTAPRWRVEAVLVDITDSWIERDAVQSFAGLPDDDANFNVLLAIAAVEYYGAVNFGENDPQHFDTKADVIKHLTIGGIDISE